MTSQLVVHIDGYPDEVVVAGTAVGAEIATSRITADIEIQVAITADVEIQVIPAQP